MRNALGSLGVGTSGLRFEYAVNGELLVDGQCKLLALDGERESRPEEFCREHLLFAFLDDSGPPDHRRGAKLRIQSYWVEDALEHLVLNPALYL